MYNLMKDSVLLNHKRGKTRAAVHKLLHSLQAKDSHTCPVCRFLTTFMSEFYHFYNCESAVGSRAV